MKLVAIGDIHGCLDELVELYGKIIEEIGNEEAKIIFLGDYVDRGPNVKGVLDFCMSLRDTGNIQHIFLKGNHEDILLTTCVAQTAYETYKSFGVNNSYAIPFAYREWMQSLPVIFQSGRYVFVHAGIDPGIDLLSQTEITMLWNRDFDGYNGDYKGDWFVVRGHTPKMNGPIVTENQINLDTGCVFGGKLSAVIIDKNQGVIKFLDVNSKILQKPH